MSQEREIEGDAKLTLAPGLTLRYEWSAYAYVREHSANSFSDLAVNLPIVLESANGETFDLTEAACRLLAYHDGTQFVALDQLVRSHVESVVAEAVQDLEYDYDSDEGDRADRAYDAWKEKQ